MEFTAVLLKVLGALAAVRLLLLLLHVWENRRFAASRLRNSSVLPGRPAVAVLVPCKGADRSLESNLRRLLQQQYPDYHVTFVVESPDDPAVPVIHKLLEEPGSAPARLLVAGLAQTCSQKIHNLLHALGRLPDRTEVLVFVDADAQPPSPDWLLRLVTRLQKPGVAAVTAYRWLYPLSPSFANALVCNLNAAATSLIGSGGPHVVWGGGWAIRRDLFEQLRLADHWQRSLSDDLVATRVLRQNGLRIDYEPACVVRSPVDHTLTTALEFLHRQYRIGRVYVVDLWTVGFLGATLGVVGFWGPLVAAVAQTCVAQPAVQFWLLTLVLYVLQTLLAALRQSMGRLFGGLRFRQVVLWDLLGSPVLALLNWLVMLSAFWGRSVCWRGVCYALDRHGTVLSVRRIGDESAGGEEVPSSSGCPSGGGTPPVAEAPRAA